MKYRQIEIRLFEKTTKTLENSYCSLSLLVCWCNKHKDIEEIQILLPLLNSLFQVIDSLNADFISIQDE